MGSIFKKIKSISKNGLSPIIQGEKNYKSNLKPIEDKAMLRADTCKRCEDFIDEPLDIFKVKDERLPYLSEKMCDECGCAIPYLLRQNKKICKKWK